MSDHWSKIRELRDDIGVQDNSLDRLVLAANLVLHEMQVGLLKGLGCDQKEIISQLLYAMDDPEEEA